MGKIAIYSLKGQLKGSVFVGADVFQMEAGLSNDTLFLLRRKSNRVESVLFTLTEFIDIQGAPVKGSLDAPVTLAVFSDFQ
jgi:hypothetical protein